MHLFEKHWKKRCSIPSLLFLDFQIPNLPKLPLKTTRNPRITRKNQLHPKKLDQNPQRKHHINSKIRKRPRIFPSMHSLLPRNLPHRPQNLPIPLPWNPRSSNTPRHNPVIPTPTTQQLPPRNPSFLSFILQILATTLKKLIKARKTRRKRRFFR